MRNTSEGFFVIQTGGQTMPETYDSQGHKIVEIQPSQILPASTAAELERIRDLRLRLKKHKSNSLFQTKRIYVIEMFMGWDAINLKKYKETVDKLEKALLTGVDELAFAKKSLEFSSKYVEAHGDDEDKASLAESILKKIAKLKKQQQELQAQYEDQLSKEKK
jgi:hypothetical protein